MTEKYVRKAQIGVSTIEADIFIAATRFSDQVLTAMNQLLTQWGMTALQHSALRVLYVYDTDGTGLSSSEIGSHLHNRVPDLTRLLDRLADKGWLTRERDSQNRRVVRSQLTEIGVTLVESAYTSLKRLEEERLAHMNLEDKEALLRLLEVALNKGSEK